MTGQYRFVDEEEYQNLKISAEIANELIRTINRYASTLYPNEKYWICTGSNADVAFVQLETIYEKARQIKINKLKKFFDEKF